MWPLRGRRLPRAMGIMIAGLGAFCLAPMVQAGGLRCSVGEVVINNLKIGQTYSLETLANLPLAVTNTGEQVVCVLVAPMTPGPGELRQGASPVTDPTWAHAVPDSFDLAPLETKEIEIVLCIPDDESLFGDKYQVNFWLHTLPQPGELLAYGLTSRLIFTVDQVREAVGVIPRGDLGITLDPDEIVMKDLVCGPEYSLEGFLDQPLSVSNTTDRRLSIELVALSPDESVASPTPGYADLLRVATVVLTPAKFTLEPGERRPISGTVTFSTEGDPHGTEFMCVISAAVVGQSVQTQVYSRIFADLK